MLSIEPYILLVIGILIIMVLYIYIIRLQLARKKLKYPIPDFEQSLYTINLIINNYKLSILDKKVITLQRKFELNINKKESAIHLFIKEYDKLLKASVKDITSQLSTEIKHTILNYFSDDGLITFIITNLSKDSYTNIDPMEQYQNILQTK